MSLRISMFSSRQDLRAGLRRAAALVWRAANPIAPAPAPRNDLDLAGYRALIASEAGFESFRSGAFALGAQLPDRSALDRGFADAILSARALEFHGGRDVYGGRNKWIWDSVVTPILSAAATRWGPSVVDPDLHSQTILDHAVEHLGALISFDTSPAGSGHAACAEWICTQMHALGFAVERRHFSRSPPLVVARRPSRGARGCVALYGHYDVTSPGNGGWRFPPNSVTAADGRLWGRGVADNKGPLACRIAAISRLPRAPELVWLIQGEEETGSQSARHHFPSLLRDLRPTLWLDETGYHDHPDRTLRLIARGIDGPMADLMAGLRCLADAAGVGTREEIRGLNKSFVGGGCPYDASLPRDARYLALGVNDSRANIHAVDESIPTWTFALHLAELALIFDWTDQVRS